MSEALALCQRVKAAARGLSRSPSGQRNQALEKAAALLRQDGPLRQEVLRENGRDMERGRAAGLGPAMLDRLMVDEARLGKMARALEEVAALPDPLGRITDVWQRPSGLRVYRQRIPLGVILMIYESRPNVTTDAGGLCLKSGNGVLLRGGSEAQGTNLALGRLMQKGLREAGLPEDGVLLCPSTSRELLGELLLQEEWIDLVIPRGGEGLIRFVAERSRIPVIKHYRGNCHIYVEASADLAMALRLCENAKVQRPGVCNAVETILVDEAIAPVFLPLLAGRMGELGVELRGDGAARAWVGPGQMKEATEEDFYAEFLDLICAVGVVKDLAGAVAHIERYGSSHSEAIVTQSYQQAQAFTEAVQSSTVLVNASTRFADGGELGLGAEIGISTTRLHAYGPMGAEQLTTTKFVVLGNGQIRSV